jgi:hypothetical protein
VKTYEQVMKPAKAAAAAVATSPAATPPYRPYPAA